MSRTRASAKAAGSRFEREIADYLAMTVDDRIDRKVKTGAKDTGDIGGVRLSPALRGGRVAIECKDYGGKGRAAEWLREAETERGNGGGLVGLVGAKRRGIGDPGQQAAMVAGNGLVRPLTGERPGEDDT